MIESHFQSAKGSKTMGPSDSHSNLIVETFDRAARKLALRPEPIQDEWLKKGVGSKKGSVLGIDNFLLGHHTGGLGPEIPSGVSRHELSRHESGGSV